MGSDHSLESGQRYFPFDDANFRWHGIQPREYKDKESDSFNWRGVTRHTLLKQSNGPAAFEVRYFEVAPQGYSSLEKHEHIHAVLILRGKGRVLLGDSVYPAKAMDFFYIPSETAHQFINDGTEPFGFLCIVNLQRDRPRPLSPNELAAVQSLLASSQDSLAE